MNNVEKDVTILSNYHPTFSYFHCLKKCDSFEWCTIK
jgi:hypothetical protein